MAQLLSCEFNIDTACVELKFFDGTMISIDCTAVEDEVAKNMYQRSELDWLVYNDPVGYAEVQLGAACRETLEQYVKGTQEHRLMD